MRISDWSSDVCSSDLGLSREIRPGACGVYDAATDKYIFPRPCRVAHHLRHGPARLSARHGRDRKPLRGTAAADQGAVARSSLDRKSVVSGQGVSVRVDLGGRRIIKKKKINK